MILLDTNVVSEAMKPQPDPAVRQWLDDQAVETLFLSAITLTELRFGVASLPHGRRREGLATVIDGLLGLFEGRVLSFDALAAQRYGDLAVRARAAGQGFPTPDGYIAAIADAHGFAVASRDASAFRAAGLTLIDPWKAAGV
ncbi:MAG: VapC toxin family PIN domain ribonuclease [Alphaproteobacteria bacterium PA2]|nr:MAG: VapC toxin family PIN domain ribonuclease [Alphaproteobacteria bacterium PA2]